MEGWHDTRWTERTVGMIQPDQRLSHADAAALAAIVSKSPRVLVIAGFHNPDVALRDALERLSLRGNVAVMTETISNLSSPRFINAIDSVLSIMSEDELDHMRPDLVITVGGAIVSRFIKQYLRRVHPDEHWHVGLSDTTIDCFQSLTQRIDMEAAPFFSGLLSVIDEDCIACCQSGYYEEWMALDCSARKIHSDFLQSAPWSDLRAVSTLMDAVPEGTALQLSTVHRCDMPSCFRHCSARVPTATASKRYRWLYLYGHRRCFGVPQSAYDVADRRHECTV